MAVIFDNDGCLQAHNPRHGYGDPEDHYYAAFEAIAHTFGKHLDPESELRQKVKGIDIRDVGDMMIKELWLPISYKEWREALDRILLALAPYAVVAPGGLELLERLYRRGLKLGVASSSVGEVLKRKWERLPFPRGFIQCWVAGDDPEVKRSKPAPDLLLVAARRLDALPERCTYVGDSKADVLAAKAAGMRSIIIPSGGRSRAHYEEVKPDLILDSLLEVADRVG